MDYISAHIDNIYQTIIKQLQTFTYDIYNIETFIVNARQHLFSDIDNTCIYYIKHWKYDNLHIFHNIGNIDNININIYNITIQH